MKLPEFNNANRLWDAYHAFHNIVTGGFVRFESGEVIYTRYAPDPDQRHTYLSGAVQIVSTTDNDCPTLYLPDGTRIPSAWLARNGMQYLCVDRDLGVAVRLLRHRQYPPKLTDQDYRVPAYLRRSFSVYWSGEGSKPIAAPIVVAPPKKLTADEKAHLQALKDQCNLWHAMSGIGAPLGYNRTVTMPDGQRLSITFEAQAPNNYLSRNFVDLSNRERVVLAETGWATCYDVSEYEYLSVVKP